MATTLKPQSSLELALAVLRERIERLPTDDRQDVHELLLIQMNPASTSEERDSAREAMLEIFDDSTNYGATELDLDETKGRGQLDSWLKKVSAQLKKCREDAGLTQEELAEKTGIQQSHISRLERGQHSPSRVTIEKLAAALDVLPSQIDAAF